MNPPPEPVRAGMCVGAVALPAGVVGAAFAPGKALPTGWRGRLALAVLVSLLLHALLLVQRGFRPFEAEGPARFSVLLREAPHARAPAPLPPARAPEPASRSNAPARPAVSNRARPAPGPSAAPAQPEPAPETIPPQPPARPSGRELAADSIASMQGVTREMDRQELHLDPKRDHLREPLTPASRNAVAIALEKRFGRPVKIREESVEPQADGSMLYRLKTEAGPLCIRGFQPNVLLSAPGQGPGHMVLVPMYCP
ncbi:hypothetical protein [Niveibacterium sp. SC-1]|uniref:hypothetical protein n=1 Tax=Niveibacterium sp. SC-1 TaxID=3135646 RepID=UPI00311E4462